MYPSGNRVNLRTSIVLSTKKTQKVFYKKFWLRDNYLVETLRYNILRKSENVLKYDIICCGNKIHLKGNTIISRIRIRISIE